MENLDKQTPGGVYLCQVNDRISCGACCGLYNMADPSYENLKSILERRTELFSRTPRAYDDLIFFRTTIESEEDQKRPYPEFHHCSYIGLVGDNRDRPGCLLHPIGDGNKNTDHRGLSDWGGFACASYFCPTCHTLPKRYKQILRLCAGNWYLFGLVATETTMLERFFSMIETRLGRELSPDAFKDNKRASQAVTRFFELKAGWKYRQTGFNRLGNYFFKDNLYPRTPIGYKQFGTEPSELDPILTSLGSSFESRESLMEAESEIYNIMDDILKTLTTE